MDTRPTVSPINWSEERERLRDALSLLDNRTPTFEQVTIHLVEVLDYSARYINAYRRLITLPEDQKILREETLERLTEIRLLGEDIVANVREMQRHVEDLEDYWDAQG